MAALTNGSPALSVSAIDRRLSGLTWNYAQRGIALDRSDRHIASVFAGIKRRHVCPPAQKAAILPEDILAMIATLPFDLRGLRDRAILLIGYAGGLRRSEIVSLDVVKDDTPGNGDWIDIQDGGAVFVRTSCDGERALEARLSDKHVVSLIKQTVLAAGIQAELPEKERFALFSGHSLRAGLASSAEVDECYVQKHLGHTSAEMTRRYRRRRDRFRVNLTRAAGL